MAQEHYGAFRLGADPNVDSAALAARNVKHQALAETGHRRAVLSVKAARLYEAVYRETHHFSPGMIASTASLVAGTHQHDRPLASGILSLLDDAEKVGAADGYHLLSSRAEANLLIGDTERVHHNSVAAKQAGEILTTFL